MSLFLSARRLRALVTALAALSCASCSAAPPSGELAAPSVRVAAVRRVLVPNEIAGFGSLSYAGKADLRCPQEGTLAYLPFQVGDRVSKGDTVARLVNGQLELAAARAQDGVSLARAALLLAEARLLEGELAAETRLLGIDRSRLELESAGRELDEARRKQADQETLFLAGGVPEEAVRSGRSSLRSAEERLALMAMDIEIRLVGLRDSDLLARGLRPAADPGELRRVAIEQGTATLAAERAGAQSRLEAARRELESARLARSELVICAPMDGIVVARHLEPGERAKRDELVATIIDSGSMLAVAPIREDEAVRVAPGMSAIVGVDALGAEFAGVVETVSPVADASSASCQVRVRLSDSAGGLRPGLFARIGIEAGPPLEALVIPESALAERRGSRGRVFIVVDDRAIARLVELGGVLEAGRVVVSGLSEGEVVLDRPDMTIKEGDRVQVNK